MDQSLRPVVDETRGIYRVPRRAFVDHSVFEHECRAIFDKCWLYLGHASELPNPGDYVTRKVAGRPMLFTRDKEDKYHALINVCRSDEHTSELQSLMRISYAVFCLKKKKKNKQYL